MRRFWFVLWVALGGCFGLGFVSLGFLLLLPIAAVGVVIASHWPQSRQSMFGLVCGVGILLLVVAYLNRQGPGTTCWHTATASGCDEHPNPLPWLVAGICLLLGGAVAHVRSR